MTPWLLAVLVLSAIVLSYSLYVIASLKSVLATAGTPRTDVVSSVELSLQDLRSERDLFAVSDPSVTVYIHSAGSEDRAIFYSIEPEPHLQMLLRTKMETELILTVRSLIQRKGWRIIEDSVDGNVGMRDETLALSIAVDDDTVNAAASDLMEVLAPSLDRVQVRHVRQADR